jgi:tetratricopeptide (TPR) repeat protein
MPVLAASPSPRSDRSYFIALAVIVAFAAVEILIALIHFSAKMRAERAAAPTSTPAPMISASAVPAAPSAVSPAAQGIPPIPAALSASERLLKEARSLNERGDTANALARLQEASQRDPKNPQVLAEMATIYESIQLFDRSNETWRKIQELGPSAGTLYELADMKLKTGVPAVAASPPEHALTDSAGAPLDDEGIPEGSNFGVTDIATEETPDPEAETNLRLKIAIKARPGVPIDHSKLRIMVLFYDLVDNEKVVPTDADVNYEWLNPKHDWLETNPETLIVTYLRSKTHAITSEAALSAAAEAVTPGKNSPRPKKRAESNSDANSLPSDPGRRKYLGYVIRIFYNDKLQTVRAEPARLLNDAPNLSP